MPRRSARSLASTSSTPTLARGSPAVPQPTSNSPLLFELRRQWKWAAVSQFMHTFASLIALDLTIVNIEEDLTSSTMLVLPRLMQRLLYTLTQDRKVSLGNWQTILRKQYLRRDPEANPLGPPPENVLAYSPEATTEPEARTENGMDVQGEDFKPQRTREDELGELISKESVDRANAMETPCNDQVVNGEVKPDPEFQMNPGPLVEPSPPFQERQSGQPEESLDWAHLTMLEKLDGLHTVIEWHFQMPLRLRNMMRSDDDYASWRTEPIGFDAKRNAYWLIGPDRLWIQRQPPSPRKNLKRKAASNTTTRKVKNMRVTVPANSAEETTPDVALLPTPGPSKRNVARQKPDQGTKRILSRATRRQIRVRSGSMEETALALGSGKARAAKTQANVKLDQQAKQLAATRAEMRSLNRGRIPRDERENATHPLGTRVSRRLRGVTHEDEWQQIPEEWLMAGSSQQHCPRSSSVSSADAKTDAKRKRSSRTPNEAQTVMKSKKFKTGLESSEESDLTDLSDMENVSREEKESNIGKDKMSSVPKGSAKMIEPKHNAEDQLEDQGVSEHWPPLDFVEWETICVTLDDWENVAKQFDGTSHYLEKALHSALIHEIVPSATAILREAETMRRKEEAIVHRKRSSRIAIKESEKEEARVVMQRLAEEEERLARTRRLEARAKKEEEDRMARELAREQRRKEREEREEKTRTSGMQEKEIMHAIDIVTDNHRTPKDLEDDRREPPTNVPNTQGGHHKVHNDAQETLVGDDWELDCEVCGARGINRDDGVPIMSCGRCSKWQHILCHDAADARAGRSKRNWDLVDFTCKRCLTGFRKAFTITGNSSYQQQQRHDSPNSLAGVPSIVLPVIQSSPAVYTHSGPDSRPHTYRHRGNHEPRLAVNGQKTPASYSQNSNTPETMIYNTTSGDRTDVPHHTSGYRPHAALTFAHYQPDQRGFSPHVSAPHFSEQSYIPSLLPPSGQTQVKPTSKPYAGISEHHNSVSWNSQGRLHPPQGPFTQPEVSGSQRAAYQSQPHATTYRPLSQNKCQVDITTHTNAANNFGAGDPPQRVHAQVVTEHGNSIPTQPSLQTNALSSTSYPTHTGQYPNAYRYQQQQSMRSFHQT